MSKYCEKCGCYLPVGEEECPACGYGKKVRIFDNTNSFVWKPEDCVNVANKPEVVKARIESQINAYDPNPKSCPYGWNQMIPSCAKCKYGRLRNVEPQIDGTTWYHLYCEQNAKFEYHYNSKTNPCFDSEIPCPKFHMDNDCSYCPIAHCEIRETDNGDRSHYKNFTKIYTCPHMESENVVKKVVLRFV